MEANLGQEERQEVAICKMLKNAKVEQKKNIGSIVLMGNAAIFPCQYQGDNTRIAFRPSETLLPLR